MPQPYPRVVGAIRKDAVVLASKAASQTERFASLKFLGHWVGDVHQPLHVSFEDDRGGNSIHVTGKCQSNLHSAWDTCLVEDAVGNDVGHAPTELLKSITPSQVQAWIRSTPKDWANESFEITESPTTHYCHFTGGACVPDGGPFTVDQAYVEANVSIVRTQLLKAGSRLAYLLDLAFARSPR